MADKKKKMAAALSAVSAYLEQEEAAHQAQAVAKEPSVCDYGLSQWSHSGRQEMMAMRRLVQLRIFDRFR